MLKVMDGTVLEEARLYFILEHKLRVSINHLPLFCVVFSLCFKICFSLFKLFNDFPALCSLIMPLLVNLLTLYFQSSMYSVDYISQGFDQRRTAQKFTLFRTNTFHPCTTSIILTMHCTVYVFAWLSDKLLQSHLLSKV